MQSKICRDPFLANNRKLRSAGCQLAFGRRADIPISAPPPLPFLSTTPSSSCICRLLQPINLPVISVLPPRFTLL
jgi:hypothetical protein